MAGMTTEINNFNKNKWLIRFSNVPNMTGRNDIDVHVLNNYIKSINIPDISIPMLESIMLHHRQLHPATTGDRNLQTINIEFNIDEKMKNWFLLYCWLYYMKHGQTCGRTNLDGIELVREDAIDVIELCMLNNDDEVISKLKFHHCIINNLSSLDLKYGSSEIGTIIATFEVESLSFDLETKEE